MSSYNVKILKFEVEKDLEINLILSFIIFIKIETTKLFAIFLFCLKASRSDLSDNENPFGMCLSSSYLEAFY